MDYNRTLVDSEQAMEILNHQKGTFNVVTISKILGEINPDILREGLNLIQCVNPRLNSKIVSSGDNFNFTSEGVDKIPLRVVIQNHSEGWQDVVREELNQSIDSSKCLLRCVLINHAIESNKSYLITTVHHAITDATSSINLQSQILKFYQSLISGSPMDFETINVLPPIDEVLPSWMLGNKGVIQGKKFLLKTKWQMFWHKPERLESEKTVPIQLRNCGMTSRYLEKDLTQKLIKICHQENTTIQGALCAAMLMTVGDKIRKGELRNINLSCRSFVDLRRRIKPVIGPKNMSCLASWVTSLHTIKSQTSFWDLARDVTHQVESKIKNRDIFKPLKVFRKTVEYYLNQPDESPMTVSVTNIGRVDIPNIYGDLEIEEISFVPSNVIFGKIFTVAVTTFQDQMIFNFIVSQPSISQETMNHLANGVMDCLREISQ